MENTEQHFSRFAVYIVPGDHEHELAAFGAQWLGWDINHGRLTNFLTVLDLPAPIQKITETPHRYGFHGTIKPPFRLAEGKHFADLHNAFLSITRAQRPLSLGRLKLEKLGSFLALTPEVPTAELSAFSAEFVTHLDEFRAPPTEAETAKRKSAGLTPRQEELLARWGYPYVFDTFKFHMTLTGPLSEPDLAQTQAALAPVVAPLLQEPVRIQEVCLVGEDHTGRFHTLTRAKIGA